MDPRTLEARGARRAHGGDLWRAMWLRDGLSAPPPSRPSLLVDPDVEADDRWLGEPWFADYDEVE